MAALRGRVQDVGYLTAFEEEYELCDWEENEALLDIGTAGGSAATGRPVGATTMRPQGMGPQGMRPQGMRPQLHRQQHRQPQGMGPRQLRARDEDDLTVRESDTAFPCASAAILPKAYAFACGAAGGPCAGRQFR